MGFGSDAALAGMIQHMERDFEAEKRQWRHEVGRAMFAMGELEHLVVEIIALLCSSRIPRTVLGLRLNQRLDLLRELTEQHGEMHLEALAAFADRVAGLAGDRNTIAHNPLYFMVNDDTEDFGVFSLRGKTLDLPSVSKLADDASAAADDIYPVIMDLREVRQ